MSWFQRAPGDIRHLCRQVMRDWHPKLVEASVRVELLVAYGKVNEDGEIIAPALKHHGVRALGVCKIIPIQQRVLGLGDVLILLDGDEWPEMGEDEQLALLDHELTHVDLVLEMRAVAKPTVPGALVTETQVQATVQLDDAGRPKLRMRQHDRDYGWFDSVAQRHGLASSEVRQGRRLFESAGALYQLGKSAGPTPTPAPGRQR